MPSSSSQFLNYEFSDSLVPDSLGQIMKNGVLLEVPVIEVHPTGFEGQPAQ
jgi:hypothetical protein